MEGVRCREGAHLLSLLKHTNLTISVQVPHYLAAFQKVVSSDQSLGIDWVSASALLHIHHFTYRTF